MNLGDVKTSSVVKGETLFDTIQIDDGYTDIIAGGTHAKEPHNMHKMLPVSLILNGDGAEVIDHPTQTMLDFSPFAKSHGRLDGLKVILAGDLRYGCTVHSLSHALTTVLGVNWSLPVQHQAQDAPKTSSLI